MAKTTPIFLLFFFFFVSIQFFASLKAQPQSQEQSILLKLSQQWQSQSLLNEWFNSSSYCSWTGVTCTNNSISGLDFNGRNIAGEIPPFICELENLESLDFGYNSFTGGFPDLFNCSKLQYLDLSQNYFVGVLPPDIDRLSRLEVLDVSGNDFTGELPVEVSGNLSHVRISNNRLSGEIPSSVYWRNVVVFNASNNLFSGPIPRDLTAFSRLTVLLLDRNRINGPLPSEIISWKSLNTLNLSRNQLSGEIPEEFASLPALQDLDLSDNQLSGGIPAGLGSLKLNFLNLSSNNLKGDIPTELENLAYNTSFLNNPGLCSTSPYLSRNLCNSRPVKSNKNTTVTIASIASVLGVAIVLASISVIKIYRRKKQRSYPTWKLTSFQKLSFTETDILSRLTDSNKIGSGGSGTVYRVAINRTNTVVAVKKIWNDRKSDQRLDKEFRAEVETLGTIRHSNIVKLLCCISNDDSKLLVYEYHERGSLHDLLHPRKSSTNFSGTTGPANLEWPVRFKIAVGAAQGLAYMHHDCSLPIVHRDVKSSNILLDSDSNAIIADFGLAKTLMKQDSTTTSVAGSFGYIAPEYAQTAKVSDKIDVYSFGVVLLELATGKEAKYGDESTSLVDWAWRHMNQEKPTADALDPKIVKSPYLDEMSAVFRLGVRCTSKLPADRPSMREVLRILT